VDDERYIEASRSAQAILVAVFLVGIVLIPSSEWIVNRFIPGEGAPVEELTRFYERALIPVIGIGIGLAAAWSFYFGRIGIRAITSGEFPPPGTLVVRRTKVKFGRIARASGWLSIAFAFIMWLPVAIAAYALYLIKHAT
jgi:hypothetical protein